MNLTALIHSLLPFSTATGDNGAPPPNRAEVKAGKQATLTSPDTSTLDKANSIIADADRRRAAGKSMAKKLQNSMRRNRDPFERSAADAYRMRRASELTDPKARLHRSINSPYLRPSRWSVATNAPRDAAPAIRSAVALARAMQSLDRQGIGYETIADDSLMIMPGNRSLNIEEAEAIAGALLARPACVYSVDFSGTTIDSAALKILAPALQAAVRSRVLESLYLQELRFDSEATASEFRNALGNALQRSNNVERLEVPEEPAWAAMIMEVMGGKHSYLQSVSLESANITSEMMPVLEKALSRAVRSGHLQYLNIGSIGIGERKYGRMLATLSQALAAPNEIKALRLPVDKRNIDVVLAALDNPESKLEHVTLSDCTLISFEEDRLVRGILSAAQDGRLRTLDLESVDMTRQSVKKLTHGLSQAQRSLAGMEVLLLPDEPADIVDIHQILNAQEAGLHRLGITLPLMSPESANGLANAIRRAGLRELSAAIRVEPGDVQEAYAEIARHQPGVSAFIQELSNAVTGEGATLQRLNLRFRLEDQDMRALGAIVESHDSTLAHLSLQRSDLPRDGLLHLIGCIGPGTALRTLDLSHTGAEKDFAVMQAIDEARARVPGLRILTNTPNAEESEHRLSGAF
jgi:hypothetical protein